MRGLCPSVCPEGFSRCSTRFTYDLIPSLFKFQSKFLLIVIFRYKPMLLQKSWMQSRGQFDLCNKWAYFSFLASIRDSLPFFPASNSLGNKSWVHINVFVPKPGCTPNFCYPASSRLGEKAVGLWCMLNTKNKLSRCKGQFDLSITCTIFVSALVCNEK